MNYKKARAWQDILLFGGAFVAGVGVWGFDSTFLGLLGLAMVLSVHPRVVAVLPLPAVP